MFQPLPVRLDHALNVDTVRLGDSRVGALQEVELLAGKGGRAGRKLEARLNRVPPLSFTRASLCKASSNLKAFSGKAEHQFPKGKVVAALHPLPEHLLQNLLWTFASVHSRPISSARSSLYPPRYFHIISSRAGPESRDVCGVYR